MAGGATPNNAKNFDLEDKIRFVELAPSMQIRLETIRSDIEQTWGSGHFSKSFKKYNILGTSDTTDTKNAVTTNANKNKIDQKYDSSEISADRDDGDSWNITGIWKNIEQIWGTPNKGTINKHDHFKSPPTGEADYGINCIWDKLDDIDKRLTDVENLDGSSKIVETVKELQSSMDKMQGSISDGPGNIDMGGGSGSSGGGSADMYQLEIKQVQAYWSNSYPKTGDIWVAFEYLLSDSRSINWWVINGFYIGSGHNDPVYGDGNTFTINGNNWVGIRIWLPLEPFYVIDLGYYLEYIDATGATDWFHGLYAIDPGNHKCEVWFVPINNNPKQITVRIHFHCWFAWEGSDPSPITGQSSFVPLV